MNCNIFSHCAGRDRVPAEMLTEIVAAVNTVTTLPARGAAPRIRTDLITKLREAGWSGEVPISRNSDMTVTAMKSSVGLCLQTGNMARMYADLIKLQTLYLDDAILAAVIILPSQPLALSLGDNIAQATRLERELEIFRKAYHVPTILVELE